MYNRDTYVAFNICESGVLREDEIAPWTGSWFSATAHIFWSNDSDSLTFPVTPISSECILLAIQRVLCKSSQLLYSQTSDRKKLSRQLLPKITETCSSSALFWINPRTWVTRVTLKHEGAKASNFWGTTKEGNNHFECSKTSIPFFKILTGLSMYTSLCLYPTWEAQDWWGTSDVLPRWGCRKRNRWGRNGLLTIVPVDPEKFLPSETVFFCIYSYS